MLDFQEEKGGMQLELLVFVGTWVKWCPQEYFIVSWVELCISVTHLLHSFSAPCVIILPSPGCSQVARTLGQKSVISGIILYSLGEEEMEISQIKQGTESVKHS